MNAGKNEIIAEKQALFKYPKTVQAARLTGCKNIAAATVQGTHISVPDWGIEFDLAKPKNDVRSVGIRSNHIVHISAVNGRDIAASFEYEIVSEIEDTFTSILMVRRRRTTLPAIRWEMPKKDRVALQNLPQEVALLREYILFLK
jgi:molybdate transport system ATP-binding protein